MHSSSACASLSTLNPIAWMRRITPPLETSCATLARRRRLTGVLAVGDEHDRPRAAVAEVLRGLLERVGDRRAPARLERADLLLGLAAVHAADREHELRVLARRPDRPRRQRAAVDPQPDLRRVRQRAQQRHRRFLGGVDLRRPVAVVGQHRARRVEREQDLRRARPDSCGVGAAWAPEVGVGVGVCAARGETAPPGPLPGPGAPSMPARPSAASDTHCPRGRQPGTRERHRSSAPTAASASAPARAFAPSCGARQDEFHVAPDRGAEAPPMRSARRGPPPKPSRPRAAAARRPPARPEEPPPARRVTPAGPRRRAKRREPPRRRRAATAGGPRRQRGRGAPRGAGVRAAAEDAGGAATAAPPPAARADPPAGPAVPPAADLRPGPPRPKPPPAALTSSAATAWPGRFRLPRRHIPADSERLIRRRPAARSDPRRAEPATASRRHPSRAGADRARRPARRASSPGCCRSGWRCRGSSRRRLPARRRPGSCSSRGC